MSTLKADTVTTKSDDTDLTITGGGTGVPNLEAGFKVGGTAGVPVTELRTGTDGELITWDASGDPATVAVGTATHVLTSNGAGAAPTFQAAAGGAWNVIGSGTLTAASEVIFTGLSSNVRFMFFGDPNSNTQDMRLQVSSDDGSSWISTSSYDYSSHYMRATASTFTDVAYSNQSNFSTGQNGGLSGNLVIDCSQMQSTAYKTEFFSQTGQSDYYAFAYGVANPTAVAHDAVRFYPLSGTITGKYALVNLG